ncbi:MAG: YbhB/YbcL family Raf kinase inhibitor-like protein [Candidatus Bathyarchaeaceae archaeon]
MKLKSRDFEDNGNIPSEFTCDGRDISPQLSWEDVPAETKSFALSVTDPDAPRGTWIHWLVHDIPRDVRSIDQGSLPKGAKQVENDFGMKNYGGPCPPSGAHRYIFTIYALDVERLEGVNKRNFFDKVEKHALEKAVLKGLYKRK